MQDVEPDDLYGGIEAGGTKFVCGIADEKGHLIDQTDFPTTSPDETLQQAVTFFRPYRDGGRLRAVGIGSFGPIDPDPSSATFGFITSTPKSGWQHTDFAGFVERALDLPVAFDTDTNAAAVGEHEWGAAKHLDTFVYLTVGTGVGGGGLARGRRLRGLVHPEMGHLALPRAEADDFDGNCPFHGDCLEGMVSGPAIRARTGRPADELADDDDVWQLTAHYLSAALINYTYVLSPQRIILGGGVMRRTHLFPRIREGVLKGLNGYIRSDDILQRVDAYIVAPGLGARSGVLGATVLAREAVKNT